MCLSEFVIEDRADDWYQEKENDEVWFSGNKEDFKRFRDNYVESMYSCCPEGKEFVAAEYTAFIMDPNTGSGKYFSIFKNSMRLKLEDIPYD